MFLSIIIPVYNTEKYIGECLDPCLAHDIDKTDYMFVYLLNADLDDYPSSEFDVVVNILKDTDHYYQSNQFDFINLIKNASWVVTNSFHGLVFSIIFRKRVFLKRRNRAGMASRIEELLEIFDLKAEYDSFYDFSEIDYTQLEIKKTRVSEIS